MNRLDRKKLSFLLIPVLPVLILTATLHFTGNLSGMRLQISYVRMTKDRVFWKETVGLNFSVGNLHKRTNTVDGNWVNHIGHNHTGQPLNETALCPENPPNLVGPIYVSTSVSKMDDVAKEISYEFNGWVRNGGRWKPTECRARVKIALIIPFRNRYEQISIFLRHIHPLLRKQYLDYRIFSVEQIGDAPFNRAKLFNIGFKEALKFDDFKCFVFHDVDLMPENDRNEYSCPSSPRHMSVAVDKFDYRLPYFEIFGGVGSFTKEHFELINGYSNIFWGWGGEDDNLFRSRITAKGLTLSRPSSKKGRYKMLKMFHVVGTKPPKTVRLARMDQALKEMDNDGLNSLKYSTEVTEYPLFTLIRANLENAL